MTGTPTTQGDTMRGQQTDFREMTDADVALFLATHQAELDAEGITADGILSAVETGKAVIDREALGRGVAVTHVLDLERHRTPHLWLLYVLPEHRGRGIGRAFVRRILKIRAKDYLCTVYCFGAKRSRFFQACGFKVDEWVRETGLRKMAERSRN